MRFKVNIWIIFGFMKTVVATLPICNEITDPKFPTICAKFANYSKATFPHPSPCHIKTIINVLDIIKIDTNEQTIDLVVKLNKWWTDKRIAFNFTESNKPLSYPWIDISNRRNQLWIPVFNFMNAIKVEFGTHVINEYKYLDQKSRIFESETLTLTLSCRMKFNEFPFDTQICSMKFYNLNGHVDYIVINGPRVNFDPDSPNFNGNLEKHEFNVLFKEMEPTEYCSKDEEYCRSQGNVEIKLSRKSRELQKFATSFYAPTCIFCILATFSFLIPMETVPGRMGLLLTLYLISSNTFISVDAPKNRGFTYLDIWMFGNQLPIIIAILEYGILLAISKYANGFVFGKQVNAKLVDLICFTLSLIFMGFFDVTYWYVGFNHQ